MNIFEHKNDLPQDVELKGDLAIDTEALGLKNNRDRLCVLQISNGDGNVHLINFEFGKYEAQNLKKLLSNPNTVKLLHYARFDVAIIYKYLGVLVQNIYCTKIASKIARTYAENHGLKDLCKELIGIQISKQQQSSYWGTGTLSEEQREYAATDVLYLHQLREKLNVILEREHRTDLVKECFKFIPHRVLLDLGGWDDTDIFAWK
ncbi:MAG: ribonuclease D [Alphaproteobacteria bacterium]